ncbi:CASH domain-dontaining protein [Candidatus Methanophagaceae archaeon]|nr:CASH domain-dontaining protein [Methanophagales archaeon]
MTIYDSMGYGFHALNSEFCADGITIKENGEFGIYFESGTDFTLKNSTIENNKRGGVTFFGYAKGNAVAENNVIQNNLGYGLNIQLAQGQRAEITNNLIDINFGTGLRCYVQNGVAGRATITDNVIRNSGCYGVYIHGVKDSVITNMTIDGAAEHDGLRVDQSTNITFKESCTIQNAKRHGINASGSDLYVDGVTLKENGGYGIYFDTGKDFTLMNSTIENNNEGGVTFSGYASGNAVAENNVIRNNLGYGLNIQLAQGQRAAITNNLIDINSGTGLRCYVQNGVAGRATITDNVIRNSGCYGVYIHGVKDSVITNMTIDGAAEHDGLRVDQSTNITFKESCTIQNAKRHGINASDSDLYVDGVTIKENGGYGIYFDTGNDFTLMNSTIENNKEGGVTFPGYAKGNAVAENNVIRANLGYGLNIQLLPLRRATITNNQIDSNSGTGLRCCIKAEGGKATIQDNVISNSGKFGVILNGVTDAAITNMSIDGAAEHDGLYLCSCTNLTIKEPFTVQNSKRYGINASNSDLCAESVTIKENGDYGIYFESGEDFILKNSTIKNNGGGVLGYASGNAVAANNVIRNNAGHGLYIQLAKAKRAEIINNWIDRNSGTGLYCYISGVGASIKENEISNSGSYGAHIYGVTGSVITRNTISNSYNLGIYLQSSSDNVIYLNNFKNDQNIYAQNSSNVWNSTQKISYTYRNTQYTSCMGNYWDGYSGNDSDGDGIGDTAYSIDSEQDFRPLMLQWSVTLHLLRASTQAQALTPASRAHTKVQSYRLVTSWLAKCTPTHARVLVETPSPSRYTKTEF